MKCPKCGFHSFDYLENCRKCGQDLSEHKAKFNLRGFFFPGQSVGQFEETTTMDVLTSSSVPDNTDVDFGFDFLDEDELDSTAATELDKTDIDLSTDQNEFNISRPFGIDGETLPAEKTTARKDKPSGFED